MISVISSCVYYSSLSRIQEDSFLVTTEPAKCYGLMAHHRKCRLVNWRILLCSVHCRCLVTWLCPILCDPLDCSLSGPSIHGMEFSRQEYWTGLPFPTPGDLPNSEIESTSWESCFWLEAVMETCNSNASVSTWDGRTISKNQLLSLIVKKG